MMTPRIGDGDRDALAMTGEPALSRAAAVHHDAVHGPLLRAGESLGQREAFQ